MVPPFLLCRSHQEQHLTACQERVGSILANIHALWQAAALKACGQHSSVSGAGEADDSVDPAAAGMQAPLQRWCCSGCHAESALCSSSGGGTNQMAPAMFDWW